MLSDYPVRMVWTTRRNSPVKSKVILKE
jgi:hypothetical protein